MKRKFTVAKSLSFQKETVARLNEQQLTQIQGGAVTKPTEEPHCSCPVMSCNHLTDSCYAEPTVED